MVRVVHETSQQQGVPPPLIRSVKVFIIIIPRAAPSRGPRVCAAAGPELRLSCGLRGLPRAQEGADACRALYRSTKQPTKQTTRRLGGAQEPHSTC